MLSCRVSHCSLQLFVETGVTAPEYVEYFEEPFLRHRGELYARTFQGLLKSHPQVADFLREVWNWQLKCVI